MNDKKNIEPNTWFTVVEMEVNSRCNRKCRYCPVSVLPPPDVPEYMSKEVFNRIINELIRINFKGRISFSLYNEPLLHPDLEVLVKELKRRLPETFLLLFTNGNLLSDERYSSLKEAGIEHFLVTRHDFSLIPERPLQSIRYPTDLILTNRGGTIFKLKEPLNRPCYAPNEMLIVTVTGDVLLCCNNGSRGHVMGNVTETSLEGIWFSKEFIRVRKVLKTGKRGEAASICHVCDNKEFLVPGEALGNPRKWFVEYEKRREKKV